MSRGPETDYVSFKITKRGLMRTAAGLVAAVTLPFLQADTSESQQHPFVFLKEGDQGFEEFMKWYVDLENTGRVPRSEDKVNIRGKWTIAPPQTAHFGEQFSLGFSPEINTNSDLTHAATLFTGEVIPSSAVQRRGSWKIYGVALGATIPNNLVVPHVVVNNGELMRNGVAQFSVNILASKPNGELVTNRAVAGAKTVTFNR